VLWVPATATSQGSLKYYFDGNQVGGSVSWSQGDGSLWSQLDGQQLTFILGAGANSPMTASNVQIWQASSAGDSGVTTGAMPCAAPPPNSLPGTILASPKSIQGPGNLAFNENNVPGVQETGPSSDSGQYNLAPFADPSCPTQTFSWSAPLPGAITPGKGSITDGSGNTYTVDTGNNNVAAVNGTPINQGAYETAQLVMGSDGNIYGQSSATNTAGQWFLLSSDRSSWQPLASEPTAVLPVSADGSSQTTGAPLNTQQSFSQQYGYFEATVGAGGSFALVPAGSTTPAILIGSATDKASHVYGASVTKKTTTLYTDALQVSQMKTPTVLPVYLVGSDVLSTRAFPNMQDALACVSDVQASAPAQPQQAPTTAQATSIMGEGSAPATAPALPPAVLPTSPPPPPAVLPAEPTPPPAVMPADPNTITQQLSDVQAQIDAAQAELAGLVALAPTAPTQ
jgi:hypothetical protein